MVTLLTLVALACAQSSILGDVDPSAEVGNNVTVRVGAVVGPGAILEDNVFIGAGTTIGANTHVAAGAVIGRRTTILNDVFIPADAMVSRNVFIGANSTFQEDLYVGYASSIGSGVQMVSLYTGARAVLGGEGPEDEVTVGCTKLLMARASRVAAQAPYTMLCNDPDSLGIILGPQVAVEPGVTFGGGVRVRKGAHIGQRSTIASGVRIGRDACIGDSSDLASDTRIGAMARTSQDSIVTSSTRIARAEEVGEDAEQCGVWPNGEPTARSDTSESGYPIFATEGATDPDPGSKPPLYLQRGISTVCGGNEVLFYGLDDNTSNVGSQRSSSFRELDLISGSEIVHTTRTPGIGSIGVSPDLASVYVGYTTNGTSAEPDIRARNLRVYKTDLLNGVETDILSTTIAGHQRSPADIIVTDATTYVMASGGGFSSGATSAVIAIDRRTDSFTIERTIVPGESPRAFLASPSGEHYWLNPGLLVRLEPEGSTTTFDISDPNDFYSFETGAFGPDGILYLAETGFDFDDEGNFIMPSRIRKYDVETGESSLFIDTINGQSFYPYHLEVDCDGDVWVGVQDMVGNNPPMIYEITADGTEETLRLASPTPQIELGKFALGPQQ
ncbi:MAG: UDP-3-O-[3-hydroxymyristoyl] glucosamine N-acyltransferase [Myxococcota bacterium]|jgi:UDP-3-O-[3-hydroxymyristoyl] glucosamine N-acyltransferase